MTTVLLVEDEVLVRWSAASFLEELGYQVVEAASGLGAIAILEARSDIALVFTDVNMPGMDGMELAHAVSVRWPLVKLIITSGRPQKSAMPAGAQFLPKPYRIEGLEQTFEAALA